ncbi:MAG: alpha-glucosidase family protein [Lautropia sp.]|nr:alpha-glucosidase family protein [Lautropia sp.]
MATRNITTRRPAGRTATGTARSPKSTAAKAITHTRKEPAPPAKMIRSRSKTQPADRGAPKPVVTGRRKRVAPNQEWWRGGVIYQIYPRSYQDSNGDGIGDLKGITQRLDYVASLGVDAIWLSPFFKSPMKDFGYDVSDYRQVDPMFGSLDDFKVLIERAHELGLRVMIDQVLSHTSDQHPWFAQSRQNRTNAKADWYVWADAKRDGTPPNNWLAIFGGSAWQWDTARQQYYLHNFLTSQPDLNLHNPKVRRALLSDIKFWLDLGVDGFRLDTVNFYFHSRSLKDNPARGAPTEENPAVSTGNPYAWQWHRYDKTQPENLGFLREVRALLNQYPHTTMVGEVGDDDSLKVIAQYTADNDKLHMAYSFDLLCKDFSAPSLHRIFSRFTRIVGDGWPSWALSNHDTMRVASRWSHGKPDERIKRLAAVLQMTMRGSPCMYQGDELGLPEAELTFEQLRDPYGITMWPVFKGRDGCRTPIPWKKADRQAGFSKSVETWLPIPEEHRELAVDRQEADPDSLLHFYRRLLAWRKTHPALIKGTVKVLPSHPQVLGFERQFEGERLLCLLNFSNKKASFTLPTSWRNAAIDPGCGLPGGTLKAGALSLEPYTGAVLIPANPVS